MDDEDFIRELRADADAAPDIRVDREQVLRSARRHRRLVMAVRVSAGVAATVLIVGGIASLDSRRDAAPLPAEPSPRASTATTAEPVVATREAERHRADLLRAYAAQAGIADPPQVDVVRYIAASEFREVQTVCRLDAGVDAWQVSGIRNVARSDPRSRVVDLAFYTCLAQYPVVESRTGTAQCAPGTLLAAVDTGPSTGAEGEVTIDASGAPASYTVATGDTLSQIAERFGLAACGNAQWQLVQRNPYTANDTNVFVGDSLILVQ